VFRHQSLARELASVSALAFLSAKMCRNATRISRVRKAAPQKKTGHQLRPPWKTASLHTNIRSESHAMHAWALAASLGDIRNEHSLVGEFP